LTCGSPRTTSIDHAVSIGARGPNASRRYWQAWAPTSSRCRKWWDLGRAARIHAAEIGAALGMGGLLAATREYRHHHFGNLVLSRFPIKAHGQLDLTWKTCEPRNSQRVGVELAEGRVLQVFNVHLGTALLERRHQAPKLASWIQDARVPSPKIVLGDFNEWGRGLVDDILAKRLNSVNLFPHLKRRRTYPWFFPILHLDHIYFEGSIEIKKIELPRDAPLGRGVGPSAARGRHQSPVLVFVVVGLRCGGTRVAGRIAGW
jgi:hypothetical protein